MASAQHPLKVSYFTARGDSVMVGRHIDGSGVYGIEGVHGEYATVALSTEHDGQYPELAAETVRVEPSAITPCTLVIEGPPRRVRLTDADGSPLAGAHVEVREVPDRTSWICGLQADENGEFTVPDRVAGRYGLRAADSGEQRFIVDRVFDLAPGRERTDLAVSFEGPAQVSVTLDGVPKQGIQVEVIGSLSASPYRSYVTDEHGKLNAIRVSSGSTARARAVTARPVWAAEPSIELVEGECLIALRSTGTLYLTASVKPALLRHEDFEQSIADWIEAGRVELVSDGTIGRVRAPTGRYRYRGGTSAGEVFALDRDAIVEVGVDGAVIR